MNRREPFERKTVVGWNGSPEAQAALDWALNRERARSGELVLVRVVDPRRPAGHGRLSGNEASAVRFVAAAEAAELARTAPGVTVTIQIRLGDPLHQLQLFTDPRWVVAVGAGPRSGHRFLRGTSLGARLAARASGPVAIIPRHQRWGAGHASGVVVGVDDSVISRTAALFAAAEADRRGDQLVVVNGWLEPPVWAETYAFDEQFLDPFESESARIIGETIAEVQAAYPAARTEPWVMHGAPREVLRAASFSRALLVVGHRSLHGLSRIVLGSVSHSVVRDVRIPTIVVPASGTFDPDSAPRAALRST